MGRHPTTYHYFQPFTLQTLAITATAVHCALSEYGTEKKATLMLSQDEYRGTACPSPVINVTLEATTLINHTLVGHLIPPLRHNSARIGAPQSQLALFSLDRLSSISFCTLFPPFHTPQFGMEAPKFPPVHSGLDCRFYIEIRNPYTPPLLSVLLHYYGWFSITVGAPQPRFGALFHCALLQHLLVCFSFLYSTPHLALILSW